MTFHDLPRPYMTFRDALAHQQVALARGSLRLHPDPVLDAFRSIHWTPSDASRRLPLAPPRQVALSISLDLPCSRLISPISLDLP